MADYSYDDAPPAEYGDAQQTYMGDMGDEYGAPPPDYGAPPPAPTGGSPFGEEDFTGAQDDGATLPPPSSMPPEESLLLREWRRKRADELEEKERLSQSTHKEILIAAEAEREKFYQQRVKNMAAQKTANREKEKVYVLNLESLNARSGGNVWETVVAMINFDAPKMEKKGDKGKSTTSSKPGASDVKPGKTTDLARMRQVLLKLKHNPPPNTIPAAAPPAATPVPARA